MSRKKECPTSLGHSLLYPLIHSPSPQSTQAQFIGSGLHSSHHPILHRGASAQCSSRYVAILRDMRKSGASHKTWQQSRAPSWARSHIRSSHSHSCQHLLSPEFFNLAILTAVRQNLRVVLICISLMIEDVKHFFQCFSVLWYSSVENALFSSVPHF